MTDNSMICAGIDVGKSHLDIALHPGKARLRVTYDTAGLKALDAFLQEHDVSRIGFEASGGYEWRLLAHLRAGKRPAARLQPAQLRFFAKSRLKRAKNDRLDAALIALFTASLEQFHALSKDDGRHDTSKN
ncbi:IS110 family transposase [Rhizobium sp. Nf11,1]|uniref:IS110 family transposase n=1 Tax=Rhizobium sp. Nf11,1 TaxID=3404923 RepID=UPI003D33D462